MNAAEVAVRAVAYAAAMFLFGASMFLIYVPREALRDAQDLAFANGGRAPPRVADCRSDASSRRSLRACSGLRSTPP